jgi:hypothetical protein
MKILEELFLFRSGSDEVIVMLGFVRLGYVMNPRTLSRAPLKLSWDPYQITVCFEAEIHFKKFIFPLGCPAGPNECCFVKEVQSNITKKCIFPFNFKGLKHHGCIADDEFARKFWCATDYDGDESRIIGSWGHCGQGCYIEPSNAGEQIKFDASFVKLIIFKKFILNT